MKLSPCIFVRTDKKYLITSVIFMKAVGLLPKTDLLKIDVYFILVVMIMVYTGVNTTPNNVCNLDPFQWVYV